MTRYKKGSIVPKSMLSAHSKIRHCITFGADVEVVGNKITAVGKGRAIIHVKYCSRKMNNGTAKKQVVRLLHTTLWHLDGAGLCDSGILISNTANSKLTIGCNYHD